MRNGGDFGFLERIAENRRVCVDRTPTHSTHLCSAVCSQARNAHHALGSRLKNCTPSSCAFKESVIWSAHVSPFVAFSPATSTSSSSRNTLFRDNFDRLDNYSITFGIKHPLPPETYSVIFFWCRWREGRRNYFSYAVERLHFFTRVDFFLIYSVPAV